MHRAGGQARQAGVAAKLHNKDATAGAGGRCMHTSKRTPCRPVHIFNKQCQAALYSPLGVEVHLPATGQADGGRKRESAAGSVGSRAVYRRCTSTGGVASQQCVCADVQHASSGRPGQAGTCPWFMWRRRKRLNMVLPARMGNACIVWIVCHSTRQARQRCRAAAAQEQRRRAQQLDAAPPGHFPVPQSTAPLTYPPYQSIRQLVRSDLQAPRGQGRAL